MSKFIVKRGKEAFREARRAREAGETPRGWEARLAEWARRAYEDARSTAETSEGAPETRARFESRSGAGGEGSESWSREDGWDLGEEDARARDSKGGDERANNDDADGDADETTRVESDGAGIGLRVLYPDTFDDATRAAREPTCDAAKDVDADGETRNRWLVVACTRQSPTCRHLAPILGILSHDSAFTSVDGGGYAVGWVDCTPVDVRPWCLERLGATAVPKLVAFANGREKPYGGGFKGEYAHKIRRFSLSFAAESTACDASTRATADS